MRRKIMSKKVASILAMVIFFTSCTHCTEKRRQKFAEQCAQTDTVYNLTSCWGKVQKQTKTAVCLANDTSVAEQPIDLFEDVSTIVEISQETVINDTVFFYKAYAGNAEHFWWSHTVFIDKNKKSEYYNMISNFDFTQNEFYTDTYNYTLANLKERNVQFTKKKIKGIPLRWLPLYQYKGKFYTYKPADFISHYQVSITDSTFIDYVVEGPMASKIIDFKQINDNTYQFNLTSYWLEDDEIRTLVIHIIDRKNGIAVFEDNAGYGRDFTLMIAADKIRNFPIVVNKCIGMKNDEFEFDTLDYQKIIKNAK